MILQNEIWHIRNNYLHNSFIEDFGFNFSVSLRGLGSMKLNDTLETENNRNKFIEVLNIPIKNFKIGKQIHSDQIQNVDLCDSKKIFDDTDGLMTFRSFNALGIFTADCLSVAIVDIKKKYYSLVHSGWRGTEKKIALKALNELNKAGSSFKDIIVIFGPSIQKCCYEVGVEFKKYFKKPFLNNSDGVYFFDNQGYVADLFEKAGVSKKNIYGNPYCTVCNNDLFFSYRLEKDNAGRNLTVLNRIKK